MEPKEKADLLRRLRSIAGHVKGVERMIERDAPCLEIIGQIQAIRAALNKANQQLLDDHLTKCLATAIRGKDVTERERILAEIVSVFETATKV